MWVGAWLPLTHVSVFLHRYQLLVNAACGDVMYALGRTFEVVLGFAVIFLMTIVVTSYVCCRRHGCWLVQARDNTISLPLSRPLVSMLADYDRAHGEGSDGEKDVELSTVK